MAQQILGFKFMRGLGVEEKCKASVMYYEEAALEAIRYVEETNGLDVVERKKLSIGPHVLQDQLQVMDNSADRIYGDFIDLLDLKGDYGNAESLAVLGIQHIHGTKRVKRDFAKAKRSFEKALNIDSDDTDSNYYMGLIKLLGLGQDPNVPAAIPFFEKAKNDSRAINALGYIYFKAPDFFEKDPVILNKYGSIRRDHKKAKVLFEKAASKGNVNAYYNMGCYHLSGLDKNSTFSFSDAYDYFKRGAEQGHTFSAYNVAIMHFLGIGTFESCQIAQTFLKHVADVGRNT